MRRPAFLLALLAAAALPGPSRAVAFDPLQVRLVADEAQAVLAILALLAAGADAPESAWLRLHTSEGYRRLQAREASMGRAFSDPDFDAFLQRAQTIGQRTALAQTLAAWSSADLSAAALRSLAYLPAGAVLRASVYLEIKPQTNSFVFDLEHDPGLFLYVDPSETTADFEVTVAHELHHVGFAENCPPPIVRTALAALPPTQRLLFEWLGGLGEGFAVLASAGGPDVDPITIAPLAARNDWLYASANYARDLPAISAFLERILRGELNAESALREGRQFYGQQGAWYTVGWRIATTIEHRFGRARLVECICDRRQLLPTYNEAASSAGLPLAPAMLANAFS